MLELSPNQPDADGFYETLIGAHRGLSDEGSALFNAKLILLLANHIGDPAVLTQALALAGKGIEPSAPDGTMAAVA